MLVKCGLLLALLTLLSTSYGDESELKIEVISTPTEGCERKTKNTDMLTMNYKGTLLNGKQFDSSYDRNSPFTFQLGVGQVIKGWDQGLLDMCEGEKRKLTIPSHLGYGKQGAGNEIPPDSTLIFEVECVKIEDGPPPVNVFKDIDTDGDHQLSREEISDYLKKQMPGAAGAGEGESFKPEDQDKLVEEIFNHEDADKNGFISHEEFSGPKHDEL